MERTKDNLTATHEKVSDKKSAVWLEKSPHSRKSGKPTFDFAAPPPSGAVIYQLSYRRLRSQIKLRAVGVFFVLFAFCFFKKTQNIDFQYIIHMHSK